MRRFQLLTLAVAFAGFTAGCGKKAEPAAPSPVEQPAPAEERDDLKAVQGEWRLVSYQNPDPKEYRPEEVDQVKAATFKIEGTLLKVSHPKGVSTRYVIRLNQEKSPKQVDLVPADESGKPRIEKFFVTGGPDGGGPLEREAPPTKGLYTLRSDRLTVAVSSRTEYRPTEFKAAVVENTGPFVTANKRGSSLVFVGELERVKK